MAFLTGGLIWEHSIGKNDANTREIKPFLVLAVNKTDVFREANNFQQRQWQNMVVQTSVNTR